MRLQLLDQMAEHARTVPDAPALREIESGQSRNWAQLWRASGRIATMLQNNVGPGTSVILCCPNSPEFVAAFVGILRADCKVFPLAPQSAAPELAAAAAGCNAQ